MRNGRRKEGGGRDEPRWAGMGIGGRAWGGYFLMAAETGARGLGRGEGLGDGDWVGGGGGFIWGVFEGGFSAA